MSSEYHVYILRSINFPDKTYVGFTEHLDQRLDDHNSESQIYSKRYAPWKREVYITFDTRRMASDFEKYLKTPSGKAFTKKHLID